MGSFFATTNVIAADQVAPSLELLEFLAEGIEMDKELIDPIILQEMADDDKANTAVSPTTQLPAPIKKQVAP